LRRSRRGERPGWPAGRGGGGFGTGLPAVDENEPALGGWLPNLLYGCTNHELLSPTNAFVVTRLDGPTAEIAGQLVDKAVAAETNGLLGRAYFDTRNEPRTTVTTWATPWMLTGAELCRELGYDVVVDTNAATFPASYPMSQIAIYAGWYDGDVSGPFTLPTSSSCRAPLPIIALLQRRYPPHHHLLLVGPLLAKEPPAHGNVYEPYLSFTPNIPVFLRDWAGGFTFGEAAWASESGLSWQTTMIGDPLIPAVQIGPAGAPQPPPPHPQSSDRMVV